jgi:hypothetical protein
VRTETELRATVANAGSEATIIPLATNIELIANFVIPSGSDITLISDGTTIYRLIATREMDTVTVEKDASLTINNVGITHTETTRGRGITNSGTLTIISGEIYGNNHAGYGGGVYNAGILTVNGGTIRDNTARAGDGGGIYNTGTLIINGGEIRHNTATESYANGKGGGVYNSGSFIMHDGIIRNNTAVRGSGGGVFNADTFTIYGGEIHSNTADGRLGGGVLVIGGSGGGVSNSGTFNMYGGIIRNNTASRGNGGGVYNNRSFTLYDGAISDNIATCQYNKNRNGGGVQNDIHGAFAMNGGTIHTNIADGGGGGVNNLGIFTMNDGMVRNNTAGGSGGVFAGGTFNFDGGWIFDNRAENDADLGIAPRAVFNHNVLDSTIGGIGNGPSSYIPETQPPVSNFDVNRTIELFTREDGNSTRDIFVSITGVGDNLYDEAIVRAQAGRIVGDVAGKLYAVSYIPFETLNSLSGEVKALSINGIFPSTETIVNGAYPLDSIVIIVNTDNPIADMTIEQIRDIFTGQIRLWVDVSR